MAQQGSSTGGNIAGGSLSAAGAAAIASKNLRGAQSSHRQQKILRSSPQQQYTTRRPTTPSDTVSPPSSNSRRSFLAPSMSTNSEIPHFLGSIFTRSRRNTFSSSINSSSVGANTSNTGDESGFVKISGRKLERWQDPEMASIHSASGRVYDGSGNEIRGELEAEYADVDNGLDEIEASAAEEEGIRGEGQRGSEESEQSRRYEYYIGTANIADYREGGSARIV
ncbi:uncharacterized protein V2V93DRAFT_373805 [Kockiozyma suomiensis]|uniref:uncharacterized protein n=1 Tax=Kockiozyma suomiensis TaxID=1337062 RepID=UPI00334312B4